MVEALIVIAIVVVVVFLSKQIKGLGFAVRKRIESKVPLTAKMERTISTLNTKRLVLGAALKELDASESSIERQIRKFFDRPERVEKLKVTLEKIQKKTAEIEALIRKIETSKESIKAEMSYVNAMDNLAGMKDFDIDIDTDELFDEIYAVEKMLERL